MIKHASIVPLIGGETLGQMAAFGTKPDYLLSYSPFSNHDSHLVNHLKDVPYILLDEGGKHSHYVDVVNAVCPCAGLSSLSPAANSDASANDWMSTTANYVLGEMKPRVFWGENAPRLASKMGEPVVNKLREIGKKNGYTFSIYKTKSILHGLSQVRDRAFYFFWKDSGVPTFEYYNRPHEKIEDLIRSVVNNPNDPMSQLTSNKKPTDNPYYKFVLTKIEGGISHKEFATKIEKSCDVLDYIESKDYNYLQVAEWMKEHDYTREVIKCERMYHKLKAGGSIMRKTTTIPKDYIGAFVGHLPGSLTHPDEDRYLTIREAMTIMKLPPDFQILGGLRNLNHMCQNVPVTTARDMAMNIKSYLNGKLDIMDTDFNIQNNKSPPEVSNSLREFF